ncbi:predicted protein [Histoplasma capsulatum G186AR]|uniref:Uncharacterized protein n=1 Tax=Ajellomyces capsulatus (strain G186AR / H82 / ATCC MYA-2454 / RMSCC 2432) TaxID=447093 RepID=C0NT61_AJECG|nr:uncharacterized protein HCBG_06341 [Histoplasma capsulatum G186AR]EEH05222.1 predicted protein [Histoplasma capsulatum G186AR]
MDRLLGLSGLAREGWETEGGAEGQGGCSVPKEDGLSGKSYRIFRVLPRLECSESHRDFFGKTQNPILAYACKLQASGGGRRHLVENLELASLPKLGKVRRSTRLESEGWRMKAMNSRHLGRSSESLAPAAIIRRSSPHL